jgi:hypothetical protein
MKLEDQNEMKGFVSYVSTPNFEARDAQGRFEGTFRWHWLASLWAILHSDRPMHLLTLTLPPAAAEAA